jgi:molybdate transport system ATP-binding protein
LITPAEPTRDVQDWSLELRDLTKRYGPESLFDGLSLLIQPGQAIRVTGPNGSGKTQFLMSIAGFVDLDSGSMRLAVGPREGHFTGPPHERDKHVRFIPSLPGDLTRLDVATAAYVLSRSLSPYSLRCLEGVAAGTFFSTYVADFERVVGESLEAHRPMADLSVGQQKRLLLESVLHADPLPQVILIDEPLAGMDRDGIALTLDLLRRTRGSGAALLVAEHRDEITRIRFDREIRLPFPGRPWAPSSAAGPSLPPDPSGPASGHPAPLLVLKDILAGYPGAEIRCSGLELGPGDVALIEGNNGSGKTGFLRGLLGASPAALIGRVTWNDVAVPSLEAALGRGGVRYMDQSRSSFDHLSVADVLRVAAPRDRPLGDAIREAICHLTPGKLTATLSSGSRALLALAQCLVSQPRLALLDEPLANVDPHNRLRMLALIQAARVEWRTAFLIVEHTGADVGAMLRLKVNPGTKVLEPGS